MNKTVLATSVVLGVCAIAISQQQTSGSAPARIVTSSRVEKAAVEGLLNHYLPKPKEVAMKMVEKYGAPNEATPTRMVWFNNGPWKFTILTNEEIPHHFPMEHVDLLRQGIDYKVPANKFNDVAHYDGSIVIDRTPGEISARCDKEEMNFLAVNLANDVAMGKRSVQQARDFYAATAMAFMKMSLNDEQKMYTSGFAFSVPKGNTGFPDSPHKKG